MMNVIFLSFMRWNNSLTFLMLGWKINQSKSIFTRIKSGFLLKIIIFLRLSEFVVELVRKFFDYFTFGFLAYKKMVDWTNGFLNNIIKCHPFGCFFSKKHKTTNFWQKKKIPGATTFAFVFSMTIQSLDRINKYPPSHLENEKWPASFFWCSNLFE